MKLTSLIWLLGEQLVRLAVLATVWFASASESRHEIGEHAHPVTTGARTPAVEAASGDGSATSVAQWRAAGIRTLASDHHSFGAAVRRDAPSREDDCAARELLVVNGYDHVPQYLARIALRTAGGRCVPESSPRRWSPRALHFSDVAVADFDDDGRDELVVSAFAEADGRMHSGSVRVVAGGDPWRVDPPALALPAGEGWSPASVAVGDVDGDGRLDLVVGSVWGGALGSGRDVKHLRGGEIDGPTLVFHGAAPPVGSVGDGRDVPALGFAAPVTLRPRGVLDVKLADVDLDGALDVVTAGREVSISYGPDFGDVRALAAEMPPHAIAVSVDVAFMPDRAHALIAFTMSCFSADECALAGAGAQTFGVSLWAITARASSSETARAERLIGFWPTPGIPSPVRFVDVDDDMTPDLIVGLMNMPNVVGPLVPVVGRPWLGPLGLVGAAPLLLPGASFAAGDDAGTWQALAIRAPTPAFPMTSAIVAYADARDAHTIIEVVPSSRAAGHPVLTWAGPGQVIGADVRAPAGEVVPLHHVPGDSHVSLALPLHAVGDLTVTWRVVRRPHLILTSACPLAGAAAGTLFIKPPERVRESHGAWLGDSPRPGVTRSGADDIDSESDKEKRNGMEL